jgi:CHAT domain-containing protein
MSARRLLLLVAAAAVVAVAGSAGADTSAIPLGNSLGGEACHANEQALQSRAQDIFCGNGSEASGQLSLAQLPQPLPADAAARRTALAAASKGLIDPAQLRCDEPQWLDDQTALYLCSVQSNSWPRIVLISGQDTTLYRAQGLPSMMPVLAEAIARVTGRSASQQVTQTGVAAVRAKYPADIAGANAGEFSGYAHLVETGRLAGGADDFAQAEAAYRSALEIETRLFGPDSNPVGETLAELALQVSNQGRFDEAQALFQRASPIIQGSSAAARARLASYLALDAANRRDFADALKFARQATAARRAEVNSSAEASTNGGAPVPAMSRGELAHSLRIEAEMALRLGDLASARAAADEALWIISEEPGLPLWWRPEAVALMAEVNAREGRVVVAERDFKDALSLDKKLFGDTAPTARMELKLGAFYAGEQVYPAAIENFRAAFAILAKDPVARAEIVPDQIAPFITAAVASDADHSLDAEIFRASQLAGSDVADQTIARVAARRATSDPELKALVAQADDAANARDAARMNLAAEYAKPDDERDGAKERVLDGQLSAASAQADALNAKLHASYPAYASLADPGPAELADVKPRLGNGEAFLTYVIGAKASYALLVTQNGLTVRKLDATDVQLASDINALRAAFVPRLGRLGDFSIRSAYGLDRELLGPLDQDLAGVDHLVVATDGDLSNLPFALLVTSEPREGAEHAYTQAAWLVRRMAVSQEPSARAWLLLHNETRSAAAPEPFFGVGDPAFSGGAPNGANAMAALATTCQANGAVSPAMLRALAPLPDTKREVETVGAALGASPRSLLLGPAATESAVLGENLAQYRIVYFATHGLLPGELHCQSEPALVLSPPQDAAAPGNDGMLYASQIAGLKLNADLVVLSACNTAAAGGTRYGGGALEGLADSFFDAGARAVLASHWEVPSASTVKLMTGVFDRKRAGMGYAEALRQAQLQLIAQGATAHPFNWAAFTLIGDGDASATVRTAQGGN